jgi:hypothetical protein
MLNQGVFDYFVTVVRELYPSAIVSGTLDGKHGRITADLSDRGMTIIVDGTYLNLIRLNNVHRTYLNLIRLNNVHIRANDFSDHKLIVRKFKIATLAHL